ncbi:MAG: SDR family NAD(P)-dependent oxidoreductase [Sphaerotilus natans subsp. sulfidivorans]|uniref:SDR family NAD(P)-dependent oxidoreductase n=1 Tax=Sphaerotilus sulfidivorans TaxID=639200 RepID=UPI0023566D6A|nr:SDR family NAD(P)-dependent oxidoreductase [Sphaerotilus sulfidivorans]MCK6400433.1 SDR family NAD(P)-dependent oxidoreductase [Sphaerotilus sulfidivorans]
MNPTSSHAAPPCGPLDLLDHLVILTGASRGLGLAMARRLLAGPGLLLVGIARQPDAGLDTLATAHGSQHLAWPLDLSDAPAAAARLSAWLATQPPARWRRVTLINNAGVIPRIGPLGEDAPGALSAALRVGLEAPMLLTAALLGATAGWAARAGGEVRVLNISSGLGRRAMAGSAAYCAAKAGMDHFSRAVALEEAAGAHPARIVSLAPGVIDTDMQVQLRGADPAGFPDHGRFVHLQSAGLLDSADAAAAKVLAWLDRPDFGVQPVADVREG